jgi:acetate kinase
MRALGRCAPNGSEPEHVGDRRLPEDVAHQFAVERGRHDRQRRPDALRGGDPLMTSPAGTRLAQQRRADEEPAEEETPAPVMRSVLVLNAGSSSLKYELFDATSGTRLSRGLFKRIGMHAGRHRHQTEGTIAQAENVGALSYAEATRLLLDTLAADEIDLAGVVGVGHRVVHGGARLTEPTLVTPAVVAAIAELAELAPLHNPAALACIAEVVVRLPEVPQVAVFDTAFHATVPDEARSFALPPEVTEKYGLRRYGFHGTSVEYVVGRAAALLRKPPAATSLVVCHLGNGASVTAVRDGRSVDSSMGFSPLGGLVMGTRSGDVDASAVLHLLEFGGMAPAEVAALLNERSGLLGLTGDADMKRVRERAAHGDADARRALDVYGHRLRSYLGSCVAQLPDLDAVVFTGGIGENDDRLRAEVCGPLAHLGIEVDHRANLAAQGGEQEISIGSGPVAVLVVPTDEGLQIARHTLAFVPI